MGPILKALMNGRMLSVFLLGVSSGLPLLLIGSTVKAWMKESQVDLTTIGLFASVGIPYSFKFLWAPLMDRFVPPFFGRRRGWIAVCQVGIAAGLALLATIDPKTMTWTFAAVCAYIAFMSASQDIAIDAYRREVLVDEELGLGSSMGVNGYRIGMLIAGGLALILADHISWRLVYLSMAAIMAAGVILTALAPEPTKQAAPPKNLREAVVLPFLDFLKRPHAWEILLFILVFKVGDQMASDMFNPFYLDMGYSKTEIGAVAKTLGLWATIIGATFGGLAMVRLGIQKSLWIFGILQTVSTAGFCFLAHAGHNIAALTAVITFECIATGAATSAYVGFMASLTNQRYTATQYALLSSLMAVPRTIFGSSSGYLAKEFGWTGFFAFCVLLHLPGLLMLLRQDKWRSPTVATT